MGERLERDVAGYSSRRSERYRVIYRIDETAHTVEIHFIGHRRDVYEVFAEEIRRRKAS